MSMETFSIGALVRIEGALAIVKGVFPRGSWSYWFPHYKVDFLEGDRNVAVALDRVLSVNGIQMYSFCESTWAGSNSYWHIRKVNREGFRFGGGIPTPSLCGRVYEGWDLQVPFTAKVVGHEHVCPECQRLFQEQ